MWVYLQMTHMTTQSSSFIANKVYKFTDESPWSIYVKLHTVSLNQDPRFIIVIDFKTVWVKGINIQFHKDSAKPWKKKTNKRVYQKFSKV